MGKLPAFQFYPGDWMKDPSLNICSLASQGLLMRLLCLCHESAMRGALVLPSGNPISAEQLHRACSCGVSLEEFELLLAELEGNGVLRRSESGYLFSQRMVKDESLRQMKAEAGKSGAVGRWQKDGKPHGKPMADPMAKSGSSVSTSVETAPSSDGDKRTRPKKETFRPPTMEELKAHIATRQKKTDPERFMAHYEANGWRVGKNPMRSWKAAVTSWEGNDFNFGAGAMGGRGGPPEKGGGYTPANPLPDNQQEVPF